LSAETADALATRKFFQNRHGIVITFGQKLRGHPATDVLRLISEQPLECLKHYLRRNQATLNKAAELLNRLNGTKVEASE
jgi:hypothetical protein